MMVWGRIRLTYLGPALLAALVIVLVIPVSRAALKTFVHNADVAWFDEGLQDA